MRRKACTKCGIVKPLTEFYRAKRCKDGTNGSCKPCFCKQTIEYAKLKARTQPAWAAMRRADNRERQRIRRALGLVKKQSPEKLREISREAKRRYPLKIKVRRKVASALHKGTLKRPKKCSKCGAVSKITAHHQDYSRPLDVMWLCWPCHGLQHRISDGRISLTR